jgi:plasmid stabilization system protein ParE
VRRVDVRRARTRQGKLSCAEHRRDAFRVVRIAHGAQRLRSVSEDSCGPRTCDEHGRTCGISDGVNIFKLRVQSVASFAPPRSDGGSRPCACSRTAGRRARGGRCQSDRPPRSCSSRRAPSGCAARVIPPALAARGGRETRRPPAPGRKLPISQSGAPCGASTCAEHGRVKASSRARGRGDDARVVRIAHGPFDLSANCDSYLEHQLSTESGQAHTKRDRHVRFSDITKRHRSRIDGRFLLTSEGCHLRRGLRSTGSRARPRDVLAPAERCPLRRDS